VIEIKSMIKPPPLVLLVMEVRPPMYKLADSKYV
jgi:hypothetical protein